MARVETPAMSTRGAVDDALGIDDSQPRAGDVLPGGYQMIERGTGCAPDPQRAHELTFSATGQAICDESRTLRALLRHPREPAQRVDGNVWAEGAQTTRQIDANAVERRRSSGQHDLAGARC